MPPRRRTAEPDPASLRAQADACEARGVLGEAESLCRRLLAVMPDDPALLRRIGLLNHRLGRPAPARRAIERAVAVAPDVDLWLILAGLCAAAHNPARAADACRAAMALAPDDPRPRLELAGLQYAARDLAGAEATLHQVLQLAPDHPTALDSLGSVLFLAGRFAASAERHARAAAVQPGLASAWKNLGAAQRAMGHYAEARQAYQRAILVRADFAEAHRDLALLDLLTGNFVNGFARYEARWAAHAVGAPPLPTPRWDGRNAPGCTLLLHFEQGLGDTMQFIRLVPRAMPRVGKVVVRVQPPLVRLVQSVDRRLIVEAATGTLPRHDLHAYLLSLPYLLGLSPADWSADSAYLQVPAERVAAWRAALPPGRRRIGLVWAGNPAHENDRQRSLDPALLAPLRAAVPDAELFGVNPEGGGPEWIRPPPLRLSDFVEAGAMLQCLDLIISVDTAAAHLAGALGCTVWTMLPYVPDWRWGLNADTTPWYPTMRLYRQSRPNDWNTVVERIVADLRARV